MSWATCSECGEAFNSDFAFDRHRVTMTGRPGYDAEYDWRCATPAELLGRGWSRNGFGRWITAQRLDSARDDRARPVPAAGGDRQRVHANLTRASRAAS